MIYQEETLGHGGGSGKGAMTYLPSPGKRERSFPSCDPAGLGQLCFLSELASASPRNPGDPNWILIPWPKGHRWALLILLMMSWMLPKSPGHHWHCTYIQHPGWSQLRPPRTAQPCWRLISHVHYTGNFWMVTERTLDSEQTQAILCCCGGRHASWAMCSMKGALFLFTDESSVPREPLDTGQALMFVEWTNGWMKRGWDVFVLELQYGKSFSLFHWNSSWSLKWDLCPSEPLREGLFNPHVCSSLQTCAAVTKFFWVSSPKETINS